jgi:Protein of unknown function (DUF5818)
MGAMAHLLENHAIAIARQLGTRDASIRCEVIAPSDTKNYSGGFGQMKRLLSLVAMLALSSFALWAQQTPAQSPASSSPQQSQTDAQSPQSARSFEGKITKAGDKLVLQDSASQTSYQLDDQDKAKQYEGKNVKVMGTVDTATNTLHIVDISPASNQ